MNFSAFQPNIITKLFILKKNLVQSVKFSGFRNKHPIGMLKEFLNVKVS